MPRRFGSLECHRTFAVGDDAVADLVTRIRSQFAVLLVSA